MAQAQVALQKLQSFDLNKEYKPIPIYQAFRHPEKIVELGALSFVELPELLEEPKLLRSCRDPESGKLSGPQLEFIAYTTQAHSELLPSGQRQATVCCDGTGTGKGRTIAGLIIDNYKCERKKSVWFSVSPDLKLDATRDMKDLFSGEKSSPIPIFQAPAIDASIERSRGCLFMSYQMLTGIKTINGVDRTRIDQIIEWLGKNFDGLIIFDEAHKAKSGSYSQVGLMVMSLQYRLPNARFVYVSATLASVPSELCYMTRLGLWGKGCAFENSDDFFDFIDNKGTSAKELVPIDLKAKGLLMARQLDMSEVKFDVDFVPEDRGFTDLYNACCVMWRLIYLAVRQLDSERQGYMLSQYWARHQSFFRHLCVAAKHRRVVEITRAAIKNNKSVIIGIESTGEAAVTKLRLSAYHSVTEECSTMRMILEDFLLSKKLMNFSPCNLGLIQKKNPDPRGPKTAYVTVRNVKRKKSNRHSLSSKLRKTEFSLESDSENSSDEDTDYTGLDYDEVLCMDKDKINDAIFNHFKFIKRRLPKNSLDYLISALGGQTKVAELTGRVHGQRFSNENSKTTVTIKTTRDITKRGINIAEQRRFQNGLVNVAIISQAASTGISLHSSRTFKNQSQRLHIVLELPWSACNAVQQLGRSHRSNQVIAPEVLLVMSSIPGEKRFSSGVAKKIQSMGALCKGDSSCEKNSIWDACLIDDSFAEPALGMLLRALRGDEMKPSFFNKSNEHLRTAYLDYADSVGIFHKGNKLNGRCVKLDKFLNRILGLPIRVQKQFIQWMDKIIKHLKEEAHENNESGAGIIDLRSIVEGEMKWTTVEAFVLPSGRETLMHHFAIVGGCKWEQLQGIRNNWTYLKEKRSKAVSGCIEVYAVYVESNPCDSTMKYFMVHCPYFKKEKIEPRFSVQHLTEITSNEAKVLWNAEFKFLENASDDGMIRCSEDYGWGRCRVGKNCWHRKNLSYGAVLYQQSFEAWKLLDSIIENIKVVKIRDETCSLVGLYIPGDFIDSVTKKLKKN